MLRLDAAERGLCVCLNRAARRQSVKRLFSLVSRLGDGMFWYGLMVALALFEGADGQVAALQMGLVALVGVGIYKLLKGTLVRERPFVSHVGVMCATAPLDRYSFPSGHTLQAVLFTTVALAWFPWLAPLLVPFALLVALSRVILGLHYPSDVVAGALLGWLLARAALWLVPPAGLIAG